MNQEIRQKYSRRFEQTLRRLEFLMIPQIVERGERVCVVRLKLYYGVGTNSSNDAVTLKILPVFDEVVLSQDETIAFCRIDQLWTLYNTSTGEEILTQSFPTLPIYYDTYNTLELVSNDHRGLYDIKNQRLLLETVFDDVDCCAMYSHLWVRENRLWGYVNKETGKKTLVPEMDMAYEANGGLFLRCGDNIICVNEGGFADVQSLRKFVLEGNGRGKVRNEKYHETVIFNIYGNILN